MPTQVKADLFKIATHTQWGQNHFKAPYQFTHALPASWTLSNVQGQYEDGSLTATTFGLKAKAMNPLGLPTSVLQIDIQPFGKSPLKCTGPSAAQYIEADGVRWQYQAKDNQGAGSTQGICSVAPVDGQSVRILLTTSVT